MDYRLAMLAITTARDLIAGALASAERAEEQGALSFEQLDTLRRTAGMTNDDYQAVVERARMEAGLPPRQ